MYKKVISLNKPVIMPTQVSSYKLLLDYFRTPEIAKSSIHDAYMWDKVSLYSLTPVVSRTPEITGYITKHFTASTAKQLAELVPSTQLNSENALNILRGTNGSDILDVMKILLDKVSDENIRNQIIDLALKLTKVTTSMGNPLDIYKALPESAQTPERYNGIADSLKPGQIKAYLAADSAITSDAAKKILETAYPAELKTVFPEVMKKLSYSDNEVRSDVDRELISITLKRILSADLITFLQLLKDNGVLDLDFVLKSFNKINPDNYTKFLALIPDDIKGTDSFKRELFNLMSSNPFAYFRLHI